MKNTLKLMVLGLIFLSACSKTPEEKSGTVDSLRTAHQALYNETMDIHDAVMPKMDNLYTLKKSLQDSLAKTAKLSASDKTAIEMRIQYIDSASSEMMSWMRQFNPPDSVASPEYREYIEKELEKVKRVRQRMEHVLDDRFLKEVQL